MLNRVTKSREVLLALSVWLRMIQKHSKLLLPLSVLCANVSRRDISLPVLDLRKWLATSGLTFHHCSCDSCHSRQRALVRPTKLNRLPESSEWLPHWITCICRHVDCPCLLSLFTVEVTFAASKEYSTQMCFDYQTGVKGGSEKLSFLSQAAVQAYRSWWILKKHRF